MAALKIAGVSIIALALLLGFTIPALAAPDRTKLFGEELQGQMVKGKVISTSQENQEFVVKVGGDEVTIKVDENTKFDKILVPGRLNSLSQHLRLRIQDRLCERQQPKPVKPPFGEEASFSDVAIGDMVVAWLAEESNLAERVLIMKTVNYARLSGTITLSDNTITITPEEGEAVTLTYSEETIFTLKGITRVESGQSADVIYDSGNMLARVVSVR